MTIFVTDRKLYIRLCVYLSCEQVWAMDDTRISLRVTDMELEEIDDFLARHPEFQNRSQLIRTALMEYMKLVERGMYRDTGIKIEMKDRLTTMLEEYVDYRYFHSLEELVNFVWKTIVREGVLADILKGYVKSLSGVRLEEEPAPDEYRRRR